MIELTHHTSDSYFILLIGTAEGIGDMQRGRGLKVEGWEYAVVSS